jgi:hypothetical protein
MTPKTIQSGKFITDDLTPFRGSWVAIRNGKVIDSALDPIELRDRQGVRSDDDLVLVPSKASSTLFL